MLTLTRRCRLLLLIPVLLLLATGCSHDNIVFVYPDEAFDSRIQDFATPSLYIDTVTDMRPPSQREGEGSVFKITYPKDESWEVPATQIYAEALAQDVEQTQLFELVPLRGQAEYIMSVDLISMGCQLQRKPVSFLVTAGIGAGLGLVLGSDGSNQAKLATALAIVGMLAIPVPTNNRAEAEVRMTLRDDHGDVVWQQSCLGEFEEKSSMTPTAREDQKLVNEHLTKAVKRANACLLGQLRNHLLEIAGQQ